MPSRVSKERLKELESELGRINTRLEEWSEIRKEKATSKIWEKLSVRIKGAMEASRNDAIRFITTGEDSKAKVAAGNFMMAQSILGEVDGVEKNMEVLEKRRSELRAEIKRAKEHDGVLG